MARRIILQNFLDKFRKSDVSFAPQAKVKKFVNDFSEHFGVQVKVYVKTSNVPAKESQTLASVRPTNFDGKPQSVVVKMSQKVGEVEKLFMRLMGVKIQILNADGSLADDNRTLGELKRTND